MSFPDSVSALMLTAETKIDVRDHALPVNGFIELNIHRRHVINKVAQIVKDRPAFIDLNAVHDRDTMHHNDVRARVDFFMRPFLQPVCGNQTLRQFFVEDRMAKNLHDKIAALMGRGAPAPKGKGVPKAAVQPKK